MKLNELPRRCWAMVLAALLTSLATPAHADRLDDDLQTVWEVLWDQRGSPQWVYRWGPGPISYRLHGVDLGQHRGHIVGALSAAGQAAGMALNDVSTQADAEQAAALEIEVVAAGGMPDHEPCATYFLKIANWLHEKVRIRMRSSDAWRCTYHEVMHAMGVRGHPTGKTVLSYFPWRRDVLMDLDKVMLAAWYSPAMPRGATILEALAALTDAVAAQPELGLPAEQAQARAKAFRDHARAQLEALALGQGEVPSIVLRSGKASGDHMAAAKRQAAYFLAMAHLRGTGVPRDVAAATPWFARAAQMGHTAGQTMFARALTMGHGVAMDLPAAHGWLTLAARGGNTAARSDLDKLEKQMTAADVEAARARPLPAADPP